MVWASCAASFKELEMRLAGPVLLALVVLSSGCKRQPSPRDGILPIHKAVSSGDLSRVRRLLATGAANPNALDRHGWMPLHRAVDQGHAAMVELLLKYGADPDADGPEGPPLHMAITEGHEAVIRKLIAAGADVNAGDPRSGSTALYHALLSTPRWWRDELIMELLAAGADPRLPTDDGDTVLPRAASGGLTKLASLFLAHGADVNAQTAKGLTPLHDAVWRNHLETATFLLDHGADINRADQVGDTPLHVAAVNGYTDLFALLRERNADLNARNDLGQTAPDCLRSPDEPNMVVLHADGQRPYEVIFTLPVAVGGFLAGHGVEFDRVWVPDRRDIESLDFKAVIEASDHIVTRSQFSVEHVLELLPHYHREYAGFIKSGRRYLVCNMDYDSVDKPPCDGFTWYFDGGCALVMIVVDLEEKAVIRIDGN
jgi:ankyrin repeat protein